MTDAPTPAIPAGWYPDPSNPAQQRWWDGTRWSAQVSAPYGAPAQMGAQYGAAAQSAPYVPAAQLRAPENTPVQTPWIWLNVLLPLLPLVGLFMIDFGDLMRDVIASADDPSNAVQAQLAMYTNPAFLLLGALSWAVIIATIVFAFLDWRELKRRGVPAPFHWAFSFLAIANLGIIYPIGRSVVVKRRTGRSDGVLLAAILTIVVYVIAVVAFSVVLFSQMSELFAQYPGLQP